MSFLTEPAIAAISAITFITLLYALASCPKLFIDSWNWFKTQENAGRFYFVYLVCQLIVFLITIGWCGLLVLLFLLNRFGLFEAVERM